MTKVMVSLRKERFSHWHIDDCWLQSPVGVDDVDELCRFWAASDRGEDGLCVGDCYGDCYDDNHAHSVVEENGDSYGEGDSVGDVGDDLRLVNIS